MIPAPHHQAKDGKKLELAQVIAPYEATSKEQLSLVQVSNKTKVPCDPLITLALSEGYNDRHQEEDRNWMVAGRTGMGHSNFSKREKRYDNVSENNGQLSSTS